jgi:hypothetical protein
MRSSLRDNRTVAHACGGCTAYLEQIRQTVALLEQIDAIQHPAPTDFF